MRPPALALTVAALLLPFLGKPLFVDDAAHLAMARDLPSHWARPYDQAETDLGWERFGWRRGQPPNEANPVVYHYFTAFWGSLLRWKLPALHLVFAALAWTSACSLAVLAVRFGVPAGPAVLFFLFCPAVWLTSTSLLIDALLLPVGLGGLALALGRKDPGGRRLFLTALLLGLAGLVKYTGLLFPPLAAAGWVMLDGKKAAARRLPWLLLPVFMFAAWCLWTRSVYGEPHVTAITRASWGSMMNPYLVVVFLSFFSGATLLPLVLLPLSFPILRGLAVFFVLFGGGFALFSSALGGFPPDQAVLLALLTAASLGFLALLARRWSFLSRKEDRFLLVWLAGGLLASFARGSGGWLAGRYFLLAAPPLALLCARLLEGKPHTLRLAVAASGLAGLLLACADYQGARLNARLAERLKEVPPGRYAAYSLTGLGPRLRPLGWKPAATPEEVSVGETVLVLTRTLPRQFQPVPEKWEAVGSFELEGILPVRVFDLPSGAGFYGSIFGPLPWSFTTAPLERALLLKKL